MADRPVTTAAGTAITVNSVAMFATWQNNWWGFALAWACAAWAGYLWLTIHDEQEDDA